MMNKTESNFDEIDFDCQTLNAEGNKYNLKISSWNVSGIRAVVKVRFPVYFNPYFLRKLA